MTDSQPQPVALPLREHLRRKANEFALEKEKRKATIYQQMQTEGVISDAKTAKLRALRMAREEADRETARLENMMPTRHARKSKQ